MTECLFHNRAIQDLLKENEELRKENEGLKQEQEILKKDILTLKCEVSQHNQHLQERLKDLEVHKQALETRDNLRIRNANKTILHLRTLVEDLQGQLSGANATIHRYKTALKKALVDCEESQRTLSNMESHLRHTHGHTHGLSVKSPPEDLKEYPQDKIKNLELRLGDVEKIVKHLPHFAHLEGNINKNPKKDNPAVSEQRRRAYSESTSGKDISIGSYDNFIDINLFPDCDSVSENVHKRHNSCDPANEGRVNTGAEFRPKLKGVEELATIGRSNSTGTLDTIKKKKVPTATLR